MKLEEIDDFHAIKMPAKRKNTGDKVKNEDIKLNFEVMKKKKTQRQRKRGYLDPRP